jgi:hypothetical protein
MAQLPNDGYIGKNALRTSMLRTLLLAIREAVVANPQRALRIIDAALEKLE